VHIHCCQVRTNRSTTFRRQLPRIDRATNLRAALATHPVATLGTIAVLVLAFLVYFLGRTYVNKTTSGGAEHYRRRHFLSTVVIIVAVAAILVLWSRTLEQKGTFLGLLGAGLAIALREPLLSVAGRIAIFAGKMYSVGDRIQLETMSGDVIDVGFFYTRMMEIGNWIGGDQASGRIVQLPNSKVFGNQIFNYTQNFDYIWDEVVLPITYSSNLDSATRILVQVGGDYTKEFLQGAEAQLEKMRESFVVPSIELKPQVYVAVTSNWVQLTMRYLVEPKKRRTASSFIYREVFQKVQASNDITIASETMDLTVHRPKAA
jgi:small-conductance mechanosensitive channel